jgi:hypothetical protein
VIGSFRVAHYRGHYPEIMKLLLLDGNAAFADVDLDAGGLLPILVELIAQDHDGNGERADNKVENSATHRPAALFSFCPSSLSGLTDDSDIR